MKIKKVFLNVILHTRVIPNLTDHERQSKTSPMTYLNNFWPTRFQKNYKKVVSWHYPKFDIKHAFTGEIQFPEV